MSTAERADDPPVDPDDWMSRPPTGNPRADLPPPAEDAVPVDLPPPRLGPMPDHVPFDMDFIARTLAAVIGETPWASPDPQPAAEPRPEPTNRPVAQPAAPRPLEPYPAPLSVDAYTRPAPPPRADRARAPEPAPDVAPEPAAPTPRPQPAPLPPVLLPPSPALPPAPPPRPHLLRRRGGSATPDEAQLAEGLLGPDGRMFGFVAPKREHETGSPRRGVRVALRTLLRQRRRMLLSIVAVALGVGYLAGSLSLLQRVGAGLAAQAGAGSEKADLVIEGTIADDGPLQQVRKLVPDSIIETVRTIPGVAAVEPRLESKSTLIIGANGRPVVGLGLTERPLGANFPTDPSLNPYRFVGAGTAPTGDGEVAIDARSAEAANVEVGGQVLIAGKVTLTPYTVTGIVEMATGTLPAGSSLALFATDVARPMFELGPDDNAIALSLSEGADRDEVAERIRAVLYSGAEVSTGEEYAEHRQASLGKSFTLIRALLVGFAGLALVVGAFTVANSMALLFDHRRRGFAMLRLMGASPSQLVGAATGESLIGGVIAGGVGLVLGLGVGAAIERVIRSMGTPLPTAGPALTWWIPFVAVLVGAAVTIATALSPARSAARTPPVHAVTGADDRPAERSRLVTALRWLATVVVLGLGTGLAGAVLGGSTIGLITGGAGAAVALVLVVLPRLLGGVVGFTTSLLLGRSVALRRMSTLRSRQARTRAASTTAALLLAAAVVTSLTVLSSSFIQSIEGQVTSSITADLVVDSSTFTTGGLSADLIPLLREQPGVAAVSGWRTGSTYMGTPDDIVLYRSAGLDGGSIFRLLDLDVAGETPKSMGIDDVVISQELADRYGYQANQRVPVTFQNGVTLDMRIRAVFRSDMRLLLGDVIVDANVMAANLPQSTDILAFVKLTKDAPSDTRANITSLAAKYGAENVLTPDKLVSKRAELLRGFGRVIQWMLAFSVILALIGVANTLQLGVNERRRELGLIRAVGATKEQVLRLVMAEAGALSVVGTVFGIVIGALTAFAAVKGLAQFGLDEFVAPVGTLVGVAAVAIGLGLVGAIVPALRAAGVPLLDAIADSGDHDQRAARTRRRAPAPSAERATPRTVRSDRGDAPDAAAIVGPPVAPAPGTAPQTPNPEVTMALRCYNCGNEPGEGETCLVCGAPQTLTPVGLFTLRPEHGATTAPPPPVNGGTAPPPPTLSGTADIVDAAVVEDGQVIEPPAAVAPPTPTATGPTVESPGAAVPPPPEFVATAANDAGPAPVADTPTFGTDDPAPVRHTLGSIFDGRPTPSEMHDPMRSPFGQHASPEPTPPPVAAEPTAPTASRSGIFSAGTAPATDDVPEWQPPAPPQPSTPGPPPAFARAVPSGPAPQPSHGAASGPAASDAHGLAAAVSRLSHGAQVQGLVPFSIAGALLGTHERVLGAVAGTSLGMATVIVVTETRALVVSDRRYVPDVEVFELGPDLTVHGRHANEQASLTLADGDRLITVDQIADVGLAVELANTARTRTTHGEF